jgi:hypothetical protein
VRIWLFAALLLPAGACGQIAITLLSGASEISTGSFYDFGKVAQGDVKDTRFRLRNPGVDALTVSKIAVTGLGFSIAGGGALPVLLAPGNFLDTTARFTAGTPGSYSANFQITTQASTTSLALLASSVAAPVVAVLTGCTGAATNSIDFGRVEQGQTRLCNLSVRNPSAQPMAISTLAVSGAGFSGPTGVRAPLTLAAGATTAFTLSFTPDSAALFSGTFTVETRSYPLAGAGFDAPLPKPSLEFDSPPESALQSRLSIRLPSPATATGSGLVMIAFTPDSPLAVDDPAILFTATGSRSLPYSVSKGDTQMQFPGGQTSAVFQTGTTSGRIRFTLVAPAQGFASDPTTVLVIPPAPIGIDRAVASRRTGFIDLHVYGFDNTLSAGPIAFAFSNSLGTPIDGGNQSADFSADFKTYFVQALAGGSFHLIVTFPVSGDVSTLSSVNASLANSTGKSTGIAVPIP